MFTLKPLHKDAVETALRKAERYRLLNQPAEAESICLDILAAVPDHQPARVMLLLALTDQFTGESGAYQRARDTLAHLGDEYDKAYYAGLVAERGAKAQLTRPTGVSIGVYEWVMEAMASYERAEALRPAGNDDALLRWNACVRFLEQHPQLRPAIVDRTEIEMLE